jgi:hypothetical protein
LVLEYVEGITLSERISLGHRGGEPMSLPQIADVVRQLAGALASMHAIGFAHGDVKPNNVILDRALDRAVLIDFGFPLPVGTTGSPASDRTGRSSPIVGGTPGFSAPEQFVAAAVPSIASPALDVYSLAAVAYAMLTGEGPFSAERGRDRVAAQLAGRFPPPSTKRKSVSTDIDALLLRALAPDPAKRPSSVLELADDFEQLIAFSQPIDRPSSPPDEQRPPRSRGVAFRIYRGEVARRDGKAAEASVFSQLSAEHRAVFESVVDDDVYYPADALVAYLAAYARGDDARLSALGYDNAAVSLPDALKSLHLTRTPETLLYAAGSLLHRFHDWGRVEIERPTPGVAHIALHLPPGFAPVMCHYFVGIVRALLAMTGRSSSVESEPSLSKGSDACQFVVTWALR